MSAFCKGEGAAKASPAVLVRPRNLPADIIDRREVEWLGELENRLAAVQAWRGSNARVSGPRRNSEQTS